MNSPHSGSRLLSACSPLPERVQYEKGTVPIRCSGWPSATPSATFAPLTHDIEADVVVIGAGLAGASLALHLAERGVSVALLEAAQPGDGASGRNAGHVQPFLDKLEPLRSWPQQGVPFIEMFIAQRNLAYELCRKHGIDGDAAPTGMIEAAYKKQTALEQKAAYWSARGYDVDIVDGQGMCSLLGTDTYHYGLRWREGGRLNPHMLTTGMAHTAARLGAKVYGDSPAQQCTKDGALWRVITPQGSVRAHKVMICTGGHAGNAFFPELAQTQYPMVACALATAPLPTALLDAINPTRAALTQFPTGLYPIVMDGRNRMISATIPHPGKAHAAELYFSYFLRYLHRTFPQTCDVRIELESYWTGTTASSSHVYHEDYAKLYQVADGVLALMNLGTWGNVMGPLLGMHLAQAIASERPQDLLIPIEKPATVHFAGLLELKVRRVMLPAARWADKLGLA